LHAHFAKCPFLHSLIIIIIINNKAAQKKTDKYVNLSSTHVFYPFAVETAGAWHEMAIELTQETSSTHLPWRQLVHGMRWPLS